MTKQNINDRRAKAARKKAEREARYVRHLLAQHDQLINDAIDAAEQYGIEHTLTRR